MGFFKRSSVNIFNLFFSLLLLSFLYRNGLQIHSVHADQSLWTSITLGERDINALGIVSLVPNILFAGTTSGGMFKITDGKRHAVPNPASNYLIERSHTA